MPTRGSKDGSDKKGVGQGGRSAPLPHKSLNLEGLIERHVGRNSIHKQPTTTTRASVPVAQFYCGMKWLSKEGSFVLPYPRPERLTESPEKLSRAERRR